MLLTAAALGAAAGAAPAATPAASFKVSLSATPSTSDPFLYTFGVSVLTGLPTAYDWAFGDGHWANGSGNAYAQPIHRYSGPGTFAVTVLVFEGATTSLSPTLYLNVSAPPLRPHIGADHTSGTVPLNVNFSATVVGGTGTYTNVSWSFGDGGAGSGLVVSYTYRLPGDYRVRLDVTDSSGVKGTTVFWVNATGTGPSGGGGVSSNSWMVVLVVVVGVGAFAGAVLSGLWLGGRRFRRPEARLPDSVEVEEPEGRPTPVARPADARASAPVASAASVIPSSLDGPVHVGTSPGVANGPLSRGPSDNAPAVPTISAEAAAMPAVSNPEAAAPVPPATPPAGPAERPARVQPEALRLSQRIVLHLVGLGFLGPDEVAAVGFTQLGMSESLAVRQNALTNVLRRLVAAGVLEEDVRHVRGQPRRLKVYRLTARGESLARDLRRSGARLDPPRPPSNGGPKPPGDS